MPAARPPLPAVVATALAVAAGGAVVLAGTRGGAPAAPPASGEPNAPVAAPRGFTRGPYLTRVTTTTARLRWRSAERGPVRVEVAGPDGVSAVDAGRIGGLRADTRYTWRARTPSGVRAAGTFTTAPVRLTRPLRLVVFGDYGAATPAERAVGRLGARLRPRLVLTTGDNSYLLALPDLLDPNIFRPLRPLLAGAPNYGVVGDHDLPVPAGRRALVRAFDWPGGGERYALRYGPLQIVAIGLRADAGDVPFLRRALAEPGPAVRLVLVHQPPRAGNPVTALLRDAPVTAVLAGHLHAYERRRVADAPELLMLTVGTGGARRNPDATPRSGDAVVYRPENGLVVLDVGPRRAAARFMDTSGRVLDRAATAVRGG